jgi:hypothetical protein
MDRKVDLKIVDTKIQNFYPYIYYDGHFLMVPAMAGPIAPRTPFEPTGMGTGSCCCLR